MQNVTNGVYMVPGQDEFLPDSHTYIVGEPATSDLSLVDPGLIGKSHYKLDTIRQHGIKLESIKRIIMTHTHLDHIGALPEMLEEMPWIELWVHDLEATPLQEGDERTVYGMDMFRSMCQMQFNLKPGMFRFTVHRHLQDGDNLELGGMRWELLHIPGHSAGGIALYDRMRKILIPGDVVYADYAIGRYDLHGADPSALKHSLIRLGALEVDILLPGHNRIDTDVPHGYIAQTAKQWEPYLR
jgi:glyoxylase-like metal-dependent hydrolase (beta-lactamase superfamily II)